LQFDEFWHKAVIYLKNDIDNKRLQREDHLFIDSWRAGKGFIGEKFAVRDATPEKITCITVHAGKEIDIPRSDMAILYNLWDDYVKRGVSRLEIAEWIPRMRYAISLMKYLRERI
jgi:hypothetical protein